MTYSPFKEDQKTAFGELSVAEHTPIVQCQFPYNVNLDVLEIRENNVGTVTQGDSMIIMQSGASANSAAHMLSKIPLRYNPGEGVDIRFTALFATGVSNSIQLTGIGDVGDGLFFGFNGTDFSILRRKQGVPEIQTLSITNGATSGPTGNITINLDGEATLVAVTNGDSAREVAVKIAAADFSDTGLGWSIFLNNSTIIFKSWSAGNKSGTFSLVDTDVTGVAGTFSETVAGASTTNEWIAQTSWDKDRMLQSTDPDNSPSGVTLDPTKLNVYKIEFQYLGAGALDFHIENPVTGRFVLVHRIQYANANIIPSLINPTLPLHMMSKNISNTSNLTIKSASMAGFIEGKESDIGLIKGSSNIKLAVGTSQTNVLSIKNNVVYQNSLNRVKVRIDGINMSSEGAKLVTIKVTKGAVLNGAPAFTDINSNTSVIAIDTAGTTFTGGTEILTVQLGKTDSKEIPLKQFKINLLPGEIITISGAATSGTSDIGASIHWRELF